MKTTTSCEKCQNSGIYYKPDGPDDFTPEYCDCIEGRRAENAGCMRVLKVDWIESVGSPDVFRLN